VKLKYRNTLRLNSIAQLSVNIKEEDELPSFISFAKENDLNWQVLGSGSNVILPSVIGGLTLLMEIQTNFVNIIKDGKFTVIEVGAGNNWHEFVRWTVQNNYRGLENLALIPGTVGVAPVQNIGAYGTEVKSYIRAVKAFDTVYNCFVRLTTQQCEFSYRSSIFKGTRPNLPQQYIITHVIFEFLDPMLWHPQISYPDLRLYFTSNFMDETIITPLHIFEAVCAIRRRKLPDPDMLGNVGSFYQNPTVDGIQMAKLKRQYPGIISYPTDNNGGDSFKLAAGWLIDQCGFKGLRKGRVGVHSEHALVLVHFLEASTTIYDQGQVENVAQELLNLASEIQAAVLQRFEVALEIEPTIFPSKNSTNVKYISRS